MRPLYNADNKITNNYFIHVKILNNFRNTSFSPLLKALRKMAISSSFKGLNRPKIKILSPHRV